MAAPKDLSKLSSNELADFLDSFDNILSDCDGVLTKSFQVMDGCRDSVRAVLLLGKSLKIVTNNCSLNKETLAQSLSFDDAALHSSDIIQPTTALIDYLKGVNFNKKLFVIGLPPLRNDLEDAGFIISNDYEPDVVEVNHKAFINSIDEYDSDVGAVILCMDYNVTYNRINKACKYIRNPDVLFLTTCYDKRIPMGKDNSIFGPAYFHDIICDITGRQAVVLGKPFQQFQMFLTKHLKCNPQRTLFIGDSIEQDTGFANELGFKSLLVLSGNSTMEDMKSCDANLSPAYYLDHFGSLYKILGDRNVLCN